MTGYFLLAPSSEHEEMGFTYSRGRWNELQEYLLAVIPH